MAEQRPVATDDNPLVNPHRDDPFRFYGWEREHSPVHFVPELNAWMVTRYEDVRAVRDDPATFSSKASIPMPDDFKPAGTVRSARSSASTTASWSGPRLPPSPPSSRGSWRRHFAGGGFAGALLYGSANVDDRHFPDPLALDPDRDQGRENYCVGGTWHGWNAGSRWRR